MQFSSLYTIFSKKKISFWYREEWKKVFFYLKRILRFIFLWSGILSSFSLYVFSGAERFWKKYISWRETDLKSCLERLNFLGTARRIFFYIYVCGILTMGKEIQERRKYWGTLTHISQREESEWVSKKKHLSPLQGFGFEKKVHLCTNLLCDAHTCRFVNSFQEWKSSYDVQFGKFEWILPVELNTRTYKKRILESFLIATKNRERKLNFEIKFNFQFIVFFTI